MIESIKNNKKRKNNHDDMIQTKLELCLKGQKQGVMLLTKQIQVMSK